MNCRIESEGEGRYRIVCPEEMAWSARVDLTDTLREAMNSQTLKGVIVDLDETTYINSAGLGAIFSLRKFALEQGAGIVLARPQPAIVRLFQTVNLPALMTVTDTLEQARQKLDEPPAES